MSTVISGPGYLRHAATGSHTNDLQGLLHRAGAAELSLKPSCSLPWSGGLANKRRAETRGKKRRILGEPPGGGPVTTSPRPPLRTTPHASSNTR
ncbi:hypothetical protein CSOJ01_02709 [Colletotrichum sojae]|uniref:Uncharacterized protein n=1 Tax=Colletotrichum sojae TaxID=2175907 RepID=A0A8H6JQ65_9PEZI|nr:hypothetical protein CSOJ01_02709 [Colletotrichum sojae]